MLAALTLAVALSAAEPGIHLEATPHRARIVLAEMLTPDQISESPIDRLSLSQLQLEERRLVDPPTIVVPVMMMCLGGTGLVGGGLSTYYFFSQLKGSGLFGIVLVLFGIITAAVAIVGGVALIAGVILLPQRLDARASYLERAVAVRARIGAIQAGSVAAPPEPQSPQVTQLESDLDRLDQQRPGLGLPIGLMAGGAGVGLYTAYLWASGASGTTSGGGSLTAVGVGGIVIGLALEGIGIYFLIDRLNTRTEIDAKINELRNGAGPGELPVQPLPGGDVVPPPPPPPPPQAYALPPPPLFAVMTFEF